jgi:PHD/YefM family antitoxin component YafN of YafNO toxin-antitoxin module
MSTIPAQEIKQRGISAVDKLLERGPVHVISRNRPRYVIMSESCYEEFLEAEQEASLARIKASLAEVAAGNVQRYETVEELMAAIRQAGEDDE